MTYTQQNIHHPWRICNLLINLTMEVYGMHIIGMKMEMKLGDLNSHHNM